MCPYKPLVNLHIKRMMIDMSTRAGDRERHRSVRVQEIQYLLVIVTCLNVTCSGCYRLCAVRELEIDNIVCVVSFVRYKQLQIGTYLVVEELLMIENK